MHRYNAVNILKRAFSECPSFDEIIPALLHPEGIMTLLERCHLKVGVPVKPMLAKPTCGVKEVLHRFTDVVRPGWIASLLKETHQVFGRGILTSAGVKCVNCDKT